METLSNPLISVIIPTFNNVAYIIEALESVLAQTYKSFEILVVDDGSTDSTRDKINPYFGKIQYCYQKNQGLAVARNTGISQARGKYFTFLDGDDIWLRDNLQIKVAILETHPKLGAVFSDFILFDDKTTINQSGLKQLYPIFALRGGTLDSIFNTKKTMDFQELGKLDLYMGNIFNSLLFGNFINACSILVNKRYQEHVGLFRAELRTQQDYEYWLRFSRHYDMAYVDSSLVAYRRHHNQLTAHKNMDRILLNVTNILEPYYEAEQIPEFIAVKFKKRYSAVFKSLGLAYLGRRSNKQGREAFKKSIKIDMLSFSSLFLWLFSFLPSLITFDLVHYMKTSIMRLVRK